MVKVRQAALDAISASLNVGKARYEAGDLLREDLLNLDLQQSLANEDLIQSHHNLELTKRSFLNLVGLHNGEAILNNKTDSLQQIPATIDFQKHQELVSLRSLEQASLARLAKARGGGLPTVDAFASYQVDGGLVLEESGDSWMAGVKMILPISTKGQKIFQR